MRPPEERPQALLPLANSNPRTRTNSSLNGMPALPGTGGIARYNQSRPCSAHKAPDSFAGFLPLSLDWRFFFVACQDSPSIDESRLTVAVIPMGTTHEYWKSIHAGAEKAAGDLSVEIVWKGPQVEDDRGQQISVIEDMISRGVDGIVLAPLDSTGLRGVVGEAKRAGIPTVIIDSGLEGDEHISFVATDNRQGGTLGGRRLVEILGGNGKIILMRVIVGAESTMQREEGFLEEVRKHPGIEILSDNQYGGVTTETAYQVGENLLNRFSEVDGIFCPNESTTFGMLRALTDSGKAGQVKFVGFDSSEKLITALEDGRLQGSGSYKIRFSWASWA